MRLGAALLAGLLLLAACARPSPEEQLRKAVAGLSQAIEARDASQLAEGLADDFVGVEGMDREQARRLAQLMFLRHPKVGVSTGPLTVQIHGTRASVEFVASVSGGSGAPLPDAMQMYRVQTGWRQHGNEWRLVSAQWTPALSR